MAFFSGLGHIVCTERRHIISRFRNAFGRLFHRRNTTHLSGFSTRNTRPTPVIERKFEYR